MRTAFIETLQELARRDSRITLITGDLGFGVVVGFRDELPEQFVNAGVAEQNMTGLAAGMALSGRKVFTYSIANFPLLRCIEQVRNDICYHDADVTVVSVGGGFSYGALGASHHATEDLAIARVLPGLTVVAPGDPVETRLAVRAIVRRGGPCYLRLGRAGEPVVHERDPEFEIGRALTVREGEDVALLVCGGLLAETVEAARRLELEGVRARVVSMHTLKPLDRDAVVRAAEETRAVLTVEEHSTLGGLGGAVAEVLCEAGLGHVAFRRVGIGDRFATEVGDQDHLRRVHGLDAAGIVAQVEATLERTT